MPATILLAAIAAPAQAQDGKALFDSVCAACHQAGGVGNPGIAPPLNDAALWRSLGDSAPGYVAGVMAAGLSGTIRSGGQIYAGLVMPPQPMTDEELAAIGSYLLGTLNQTGRAIDPALIAKTRAALPSHSALQTLRKGS
ncbi:c-type cytochrome [Inquilinus ginsengisoli]|uniref:c-type cytochrome n=1 Tax=Inquilinus ginsengisoli TaxID=363840 RepID=UPI003D225913